MNPLPLSLVARSGSNSRQPLPERDVIQDWLGQRRFFAPTAHHRIICRACADRDFGARQIRNVEQQITLPVLRFGCSPNEFSDLVADPAHSVLQRGGIFPSTACAADFLAQPFPVCVALLQGGLHFPSLRIDREHFINLRRIIASTGREPAFHKVGLVTDQANIEHRGKEDRIDGINRIFLILVNPVCLLFQIFRQPEQVWTESE